MFVANRYDHPLGPRLGTHRGLFYEWHDTHWVEIARGDVSAELYAWLEHAVYRHPKDGLVRFAPTKFKITNIVDALSAAEYVRSDVEPPAWRSNEAPWGDSDVVVLQNGVLARESRTLYPHAPQLLNLHALPFDYDSQAPPPKRWLRFLRELWEDDAETIATVQEIVGYLVGGGTEQQKLFAFIGPRRSGKGTIARVLTGLLGAENVAAPPLAALSSHFGLAVLIGKPLALIGDARLSKRADSALAVERLLTISGEDSISIPRKYKNDWSGRLPTRFLLLSNELPQFDDASATIASRFIIAMFQTSFYGRENTTLTKELLGEATGIFNWALEGLDRLSERGNFVQPESSASAIQHMEDLASPVGAFLRDRCVVEPDATVKKDDLWATWKEWAEDAGIRKGTKDTLIRDLRAVNPRITSTRPTIDGKRVYTLTGVRLLASSETVQKTPDTPDRSRTGPISVLSDLAQPSPPSTLSGVEPIASPGSLDGDEPDSPDDVQARLDAELGL